MFLACKFVSIKLLLKIDEEKEAIELHEVTVRKLSSAWKAHMELVA